ncbi:DedA family protein [Gemmatimonas groenlandica]|uniref:DedA family protein n=1 Tax=Gemmatimonas groenlandica TaxID=2732249 RepID=A0A6M4IQF7_9BACT|nr:DedA family protein [Gemmatimonas groenlandica]QJR35072.1 DedA family protein [Gemmatimonas groenlandica]
MTDILAWLSSLPEPLLYGALVLAAFAENIFPPLPADTVIALGAFVAARGNGSAVGVWTATMIGNIGGAMMMYGLGHHFGLPWLMQRFPSLFPAGATQRVTERFKSQGVLAVIVSRFLPGVRAVVPPLAGAMGIGAVRALLAMSLASGAWYGLVCVLAFRAGANADALLARIAAQQRTVGLVAAAIVVLAIAVIWWRRRSSRP